MANMPASVHTERMSAPVEFGHSRASSSNLRTHARTHAGVAARCGPSELSQ